jgi:hypothetical protein
VRRQQDDRRGDAHPELSKRVQTPVSRQINLSTPSSLDAPAVTVRPPRRRSRSGGAVPASSIVIRAFLIIVLIIIGIIAIVIIPSHCLVVVVAVPTTLVLLLIFTITTLLGLSREVEAAREPATAAAGAAGAMLVEGEAGPAAVEAACAAKEVEEHLWVDTRRHSGSAAAKHVGWVLEVDAAVVALAFPGGKKKR